MDTRPISLNDFLSSINIPTDAAIPWSHSTSSSNLLDIINDGEILATPCKVFGEKLCYFFVGRPAYKGKLSEDVSEWQLPVAFVMRFQKPLPIKRIFPFDSGAFHDKRLPEFITMFKRGRFEMPGNNESIGRLISFYFKSPDRYFGRRPAGENELRDEHNLDPRHREIMALHRLYGEKNSPEYDDRAAAIEVQVEQDIPLMKENLLGIVMPAEFSRVPGFLGQLRSLTPFIEEYDVMPLGALSAYGQLYQGVRNVYKKAGINL